MKSHDRASSRVLDSLWRNLASNEPRKATKQLWSFRGSDVMLPELVAGDRLRILLDETLKEETHRLRKLVTENTRVRKAPFLSFSSAVGEVFHQIAKHGEYSLADIGEIRDLYAAYRRNLAHFAPIRTALRKRQNGWGTFYCCVAEPGTEFFAVASGHAETALVHFDQWLHEPDGKGELIGKLAAELEPFLSADCCLVKVIKEFGPRGPEQLWDQVRHRLHYRGPLYTYDQETGKGRLSRRGRQKTPKRLLVLYDLVKSGDGLKKVEDDLRSRFGRSGTEIHHFILYDYSRGKALANTHPIYDSREHPSLQPGRLAQTFATGTAVFGDSDRVFERFTLEQVDPVGAQRPDYQEDMQWLVQSEGLARKYEGRWVAVCHRKVVAAGDSYEEVLEQAQSAPEATMPILHHFPPSEAIYAL